MITILFNVIELKFVVRYNMIQDDTKYGDFCNTIQYTYSSFIMYTIDNLIKIAII